MTRKVLLAVLVLGLASGVAAAGEAYFGASYGKVNLKDEDAGFDFNADDTALKVYGGFRFMKFFGVEGGYVDMGSLSDSGGGIELTSEPTGWDVFAVGVIPLGKVFEIWGKVGVALWKSDVTLTSGPITLTGSDDGTDAAYAAGAAFNVGDHLRIRLEYEMFDISDFDDLYIASGGLDIRF